MDKVQSPLFPKIFCIRLFRNFQLFHNFLISFAVQTLCHVDFVMYHISNDIDPLIGSYCPCFTIYSGSNCGLLNSLSPFSKIISQNTDIDRKYASPHINLITCSCQISQLLSLHKEVGYLNNSLKYFTCQMQSAKCLIRLHAAQLCQRSCRMSTGNLLTGK